MKKATNIRNKRGLWLLLIILVAFISLSIVYQYTQWNGKLKIGTKPTQEGSTSAKFIEVEPNESFSNASELKPGYETQGTLSTGKDIDMYWFTVDRPSTAIFTSRNLPNEYDVTVYNSDQTPIATATRLGFTESSSTLTIQKPGKYYLKVVTNSNEILNLPYTITLTLRPFFE